MKKFVVYLMVIVLAVSLGFAVFYLVKDDEVISISSASIYTDVNKEFTIDVNHENKKSYTKINISSSNDNVVKYNEGNNSFSALSGGVARINFRTNNVKFRNLWCDVIVGDGTETSPFYISSVEQLSAIGMGEQNEDGTYMGKAPYTDYSSDKCYKLVSDIDVKSINEGHWLPLRNFSGTFDGNGYTISNVNIDYDIYTELYKNANDYNPNLHATDNVGFFQSIDVRGKVFNIKFDNYRASGRYTNFGTIAGVNKGTIERIEVKDAYISVETTNAFGGLVGENTTTDSGSGTSYERFIARIDRSSVNLTLGKKRTFEDEEWVESVIGNTGVIGGLVGINNGGTIVYSYTNGEVNFLSDSVDNIVYGGLIGENTFVELTDKGGLYASIYQGANVKDCYSNIKTHFELSLTNAETKIGGGIGSNNDYSNTLYDFDVDKEIVQNYIIGVYYNNDNLNAVEEGITKGYNGIGEFTYNNKVIDYVEDENLPIVLGLSNDGMKDSSKFISHYTSDIAFDEEGNSLGVKSIAVNWLFDTVWAISESENDGMPYLNYQLVYIPNDFNTVGTPVVISNKYQYINTEVEYPVTIVSGYNKRIDIEVGEEYNLKVNPAGLTLNWDSNNESVVSVDGNGTIKGLQPGSASISVTTKTGLFTDYIDVYVSGVSYSITNVPAEIPLNVGETYTFENVIVTPSTTLTYTSSNELIASVDGNGKITALNAGETFITLKAGQTEKVVKVKVYAQESTVRAVKLTLSSFAIFETYSGTPKLGQLTVKSAKCDNVEIKDTLKFRYTSTNSNIVSVDNNGNYMILGTGSVVIEVEVDSNIYEGYAQCVLEIEVDDQGETPPVVAGLVRKSYNINVGDKVAIETYGSIKSITWISSNTNIVSVDSNGIITGVSKGTATIFVQILKTDNIYTHETCDVTVVDNTPTPVITLSAKNVDLYVGDTFKLTASLNIQGTLDWAFEQNPNNIASISVSGNIATITILNPGTITVSVSYGTAVKTAIIKATAKNTYTKEIYTIDQLKNIHNFLNREFVLMNDLDLTGIDWNPIGTESKPFTGKFSSRLKNSYESFKITGLNVSGVAYGGLFGYANGATFDNVYVANSTIKATNSAGAIVGAGKNLGISNCVSENNIITAVNAGGVIGNAISGCSIYNCTVEETTVTTVSSNSANIGGLVGYLGNNSSTMDTKIINNSKYISMSSGSHGNAGGVAGYALGKVNGSRVTAKIKANDSDSDYAGGIVGYSTSNIINGVITNTTIEGYYAGGIGGAINTGDTISLSFDVTNNGYRKEDLSYHSAYFVDVHLVAVKDSVSIRGEEVGGLFGIINSGVVRNCYTRAYLNGYDSKSYVSGFASLIMSSGFGKDGGRGQVGIIENCYSACTFSGSCYDYAISKSQIHDDYKNRSCGYVFNFVFDGTLAKNTDYIDASGFFKKDPVQAKKTTSEMKNKDTYTSKDFSSTYWNFSGGYPTLIIED